MSVVQPAIACVPHMSLLAIWLLSLVSVQYPVLKYKFRHYVNVLIPCLSPVLHSLLFPLLGSCDSSSVCTVFHTVPYCCISLHVFVTVGWITHAMTVSSTIMLAWISFLSPLRYGFRVYVLIFIHVCCLHSILHCIRFLKHVQNCTLAKLLLVVGY